MKSVDEEEIKRFLINYLSKTVASRRLMPETLDSDLDLLGEGIIDSLGVIELISEIEKHLGITIDFEDLPAEEFTRVGPFCRYVATQVKGRAVGFHEQN